MKRENKRIRLFKEEPVKYMWKNNCNSLVVSYTLIGEICCVLVNVIHRIFYH